jgi:hypothetical protein
MSGQYSLSFALPPGSCQPIRPSFQRSIHGSVILARPLSVEHYQPARQSVNQAGDLPGRDGPEDDETVKFYDCDYCVIEKSR